MFLLVAAEMFPFKLEKYSSTYYGTADSKIAVAVK
jgi:hypothetical protein